MVGIAGMSEALVDEHIHKYIRAQIAFGEKIFDVIIKTGIFFGTYVKMEQGVLVAFGSVERKSSFHAKSPSLMWESAAVKDFVRVLISFGD